MFPDWALTNVNLVRCCEELDNIREPHRWQMTAHIRLEHDVQSNTVHKDSDYIEVSEPSTKKMCTVHSIFTFDSGCTPSLRASWLDSTYK